MSELIDMKLKKKGKDNNEAKIEYSPPEYPYGLEIRLETEQIDKMPELIKMNPGDRVTINGEGCVTGISINQGQNDKDRKSVSIQIEKVLVTSAKKKKLENMSMKEYRNARTGQ